MIKVKKILIDARESGTSTGRYIDKLIEYLHKLSPIHEVIILTKTWRVDYFKKIAPTFNVIESPYEEFTFGEQLGLKRQIEKLKPDLVHFGMVQQPVLYRGRVVTTMHDLTGTRFSNPSKNQIVYFLKQLIYKWINKRAAHKSEFIIVPTEFVKKDVAQYCKVPAKKIIVTLESADKINEPAKPLPTLEGKRFIMYVGRPMPHKNLARLIEAHQLLLETMPDLRLVLAGKKDSIYEGFETDAQRRNLKNIVFTGFVSDGELRWLYENTACYVFPSLSEGFGLPSLEAMAHGAPVASSNATCLPEVNGPAAIYFDPHDSRGMARAISDVINDKALNKKLRDLGAEQIKKYSWERMAKATFDIYNRILSL